MCFKSSAVKNRTLQFKCFEFKWTKKIEREDYVMGTEIAFQNFLEYWAEKTPEKEAVYDGFRRMSYYELQEEIRQMAIALSKLNIQKGDRVLTSIPNWHEFVILMFALEKFGAIIVPSNTKSAEPEIKYLMEEIQPKAVFLFSPDQLSWVKDYEQFCTVITVRFHEKGYRSFDSLLDTGKDGQLDLAKINPEQDVLCIMHSSGTTGYPKGVQLTYRNIFAFVTANGEVLECTDQDVTYNPLPHTHVFGFIIGIIIPLYFGGKTVLTQAFDPKRALILMEEEKVSISLCVPSMLIREMEEYKQEPKDVTSLKIAFVAAASCPAKVLEEAYATFHCTMMVAYGSTEAGIISSSRIGDSMEKVCETVGRAVKGVQIKAVDDKGESVGPGEAGELLVKGPLIMKGYYQKLAETEQVIDKNGWLHMGDIATIDSFGYIKIVGRKKEVIIRGGENIYPAELEKVYYSHPSVMEVCILGFPHEVLGEQTYAFIKLEDTSLENEETLREYARGKIAKHKIPDKVIILPEMPHLPGGKIDKRELKSIN